MIEYELSDCPYCGGEMREQHQHYRCPKCGFIEPCCQGAPARCPTPEEVLNFRKLHWELRD